MAKWAAKVERDCQSTLKSSENVLGATFGQPLGTLWAQAIGAGVGVGVSLLVMSDSLGAALASAVGAGLGALLGLSFITFKAKRAVRERSEVPAGAAAPMAAVVPSGRVMVALTDKRLLFFHLGSFSNNPKQLLLEFDTAQAPVVNIDGANKFAGKMSFVFSDQTSAEMEVVKAGLAKEFLDAVQEASS